MYIAFIMKPMGDIDWIRTFPTEAEADDFSKEQTAYSELEPEDDPDHWKKYDPPVVILFEAENSDAMENGKYKQPTAIYQRGEKYVCVRSSI
jgi:hypothetical protein